MSRLTVTIGVIVLVGILVIAGSQILTRGPNPGNPPQAPVLANVSFSLDFPKTLSPGTLVQSTVHASVLGDDIKNVSVHTDSIVLIIASDSLDIKSGTSANFNITLSTNDVQDGPYSANVWLTYSGTSGTNSSKSITESFYVLPKIQLEDVRFAPDFWHPFGKGTIGQTDSTNLLFKVSSGSKKVIYQGIYVTTSLSVAAPGMTLNVSSIPVSALGPQGTSKDYSITAESNNTPPGQYVIFLMLYSKDNQFVTQAFITLTVSA
jgi:hypothetical protein